MIADAGFVLFDNLLDHVRVEPPGIGNLAFQERVAHTLAQGAPEPAGQRNREAHLGAIQDIGGQHGLHAFLQQELALALAHLEVRGEGRQPFHQLVIHQRFADFERVRHACPVDLGVDVADEIGVRVDVLDQPEGIVRIGFAGVFIEDIDGAVSAKCARKLLL